MSKNIVNIGTERSYQAAKAEFSKVGEDINTYKEKSLKLRDESFARVLRAQENVTKKLRQYGWFADEYINAKATAVEVQEEHDKLMADLLAEADKLLDESAGCFQKHGM